MFDTTEWICVNTITSCELVSRFDSSSSIVSEPIAFIVRHSVTSLSFSYDGEYLAIASQGSYIDIVRWSLYFVASCLTTINLAVFIRNLSPYTPCSYIGTSPRRCMASFEAYLCMLWASESWGLDAVSVLESFRPRGIKKQVLNNVLSGYIVIKHYVYILFLTFKKKMSCINWTYNYCWPY